MERHSRCRAERATAKTMWNQGGKREIVTGVCPAQFSIETVVQSEILIVERGKYVSIGIDDRAQKPRFAMSVTQRVACMFVVGDRDKKSKSPKAGD